MATPKKAINLLLGWPARSLLPLRAIQAVATAVLTDPEKGEPALLYGPDQGYPPLKSQIAVWLNHFYGRPPLDAEPARICISGGASQNFARILDVYADPGVTRNAWLVAPCYHLACRILVDAGFAGRLRGVPEDDQGIDVQYLEREIEKADAAQWERTALKPIRPWNKTYRHLIYAVPTFANPSGKTMSLGRRQQLVALARRHDALIVTDDVYDFLQWPSAHANGAPAPDRGPLPRLVDVDRDLPGAAADGFGNAVSNGSFSKIVGPGIRTGWAEGTERFAHGLLQAGSSRSGGAPSQIAAAFVAEYLASGELQRAIADTLIPAYEARHRAMVGAIEKYLLPLDVRMPKVDQEGVLGGFFVWIVLPDGLTADEVTVEAKGAENLTISPGTLFAVQGDESVVDLSGSVRLCFAWEDENAIQEGIQRLARVLQAMLQRNTNA